MGQKQSVSRKKLKSVRPSYSKTECTEIVEIEHSDVPETKPEAPSVSNQNGLTNTNEETSVKPNYPPELLKVIRRIEEMEQHIENMTGSELHLYFPTLKDDLHNNWEKVYGVRNTTDEIRLKKIETIDKIKAMLKNLNERYLRKSRREYRSNR